MSIESRSPLGAGARQEGRMDLSARDQGKDDRKRAELPEEAKLFRKVLTDDESSPREPSSGPVGESSLFRGLSFGQGGEAPVEQSTAPRGPEKLDELVNACVHRILVSDESSGQREVRIDLSDAAFPGLSVRVFEQEGNLVACFVCGSEPVRAMMGGMTRDLARHLAGRLSRDVLVQVRSDDDEDPRLIETVMRSDED